MPTTGIEPATFCLQGSCAASCATPAFCFAGSEKPGPGKATNNSQSTTSARTGFPWSSPAFSHNAQDGGTRDQGPRFASSFCFSIRRQLRRMDLHHRPSSNEPDNLLLIYSATKQSPINGDRSYFMESAQSHKSKKCLLKSSKNSSLH